MKRAKFSAERNRGRMIINLKRHEPDKNRCKMEERGRRKSEKNDPKQKQTKHQEDISSFLRLGSGAEGDGVL